MPDHDLAIDRARNGWVISTPSGVEVVEGMDSDNEPSGYALFNYLIEELGLTGTRYDAQRLFIGMAPGDKHHDVHPQLCSKCECKCVPDESTGPLDTVEVRQENEFLQSPT